MTDKAYVEVNVVESRHGVKVREWVDVAYITSTIRDALIVKGAPEYVTRTYGGTLRYTLAVA